MPADRDVTRRLEEAEADRDRYQRGLLACDENNKRLRNALDSLAGRAEDAAEYLRHGIDPTNESDLLGFWLESEAEAVRRMLDPNAD